MKLEPRHRTALGIGILTLLGVIAFFLTWRTLTADGVHGRATGLTSTLDTDRGSSHSNNTVAAAVFLFPIIGATLIGVPKLPRVGAVLTALTGVLVIWTAVAVLTGDASTVFGFDQADANLEPLLKRAANDGTVSVGVGVYLALIAGLLMIAAGAYEFARIQRASNRQPSPPYGQPHYQEPAPRFGPGVPGVQAGPYPPQEGGQYTHQQGRHYPPQQGHWSQS